MENLKSYRNKLAQLTPGETRHVSFIAQQAAEERILARRVETGETIVASNGKPIPEGHYAIVEVDEEGLTVIAAEPTFFALVWELDTPQD